MADTQTTSDEDFDDLDKPVFRKKRNPLALIIPVLLLLLLLGAGVLYFLWTQGQLPMLDPIMSKIEKTLKSQSISPEQRLVELPLGPMIFTLMQSQGRNYQLLVDIIVVTRGETNSVEIQTHTPLVRHIMNMHLREIRLDDLRERGNLDALRAEIKERLNAALDGIAEVEEVLFKEVNIQQ